MGSVRGILCGKCNTGLGYLGDTSGLILRAAEYITKSDRKTELLAQAPAVGK